VFCGRPHEKPPAHSVSITLLKAPVRLHVACVAMGFLAHAAISIPMIPGMLVATSAGPLLCQL